MITLCILVQSRRSQKKSHPVSLFGGLSLLTEVCCSTGQTENCDPRRFARQTCQTPTFRRLLDRITLDSSQNGAHAHDHLFKLGSPPEL